MNSTGPRSPRRRGPRRALRQALTGLLTLVCLCGGQLLVSPTASGQSGLDIELNTVEDQGGGCVASFVFQNDLGAALDRFNLDLVLFDGQGAILRRLMLDLAPLSNGKTRVASFRLHEEACSKLGRVLINDIPACRAEGGGDLDCLAGLTVHSRTTIGLTK